MKQIPCYTSYCQYSVISGSHCNEYEDGCLLTM